MHDNERGVVRLKSHENNASLCANLLKRDFFFFFGKYDLAKFIIRRIDEREIYHYRDQDLLILEWIDILDCNASNILK